MLARHLAGSIACALLLMSCTGSQNNNPISQAAPGASPARGAASPTPAPGGGSTPAAAGPSRCHVSQLAVSYVTSEGAAGHIILTFHMANSSSTMCWIYGFVGMQMLDGGGGQIPTRVVRNGGFFLNQPGPSQFDLSPGQAGTFLVAFGDVPVGSETTCSPAAQLIVTPPDEFDHVTLKVQGWSLAPCNAGELDVTPVRAPA